MKNVVFKNCINWILYSLLIQHPAITYHHIIGVSIKNCTNIRFRDDSVLVFCRQIMLLLATDADKSKVLSLFKSLSWLSLNEKKLLAKSISLWYESKKFITANEDEIVLYKSKKISFDDYLKKLGVKECIY